MRRTRSCANRTTPGRRAKTPGTPRKTKLKDGSTPEKFIQSDILNWLKQTGLLHWRQNSGVVFVGKRRVKLGEEGMPDIIVIVPPHGRFVGLEVKSAKGKLRPKQIEFKAAAEATGGYYFVVRSLPQAMDAVAQAVGKEVWDGLRARSSF